MIAMNHTVTIRTDTDEICFGINDDLFITRTQWPDMMNFDKATTYFAIFFLGIFSLLVSPGEPEGSPDGPGG